MNKPQTRIKTGNHNGTEQLDFKIDQRFLSQNFKRCAARLHAFSALRWNLIKQARFAQFCYKPSADRNAQAVLGFHLS